MSGVAQPVAVELRQPWRTKWDHALRVQVKLRDQRLANDLALQLTTRTMTQRQAFVRLAHRLSGEKAHVAIDKACAQIIRWCSGREAQEHGCVALALPVQHLRHVNQKEWEAADESG